MRLAVLKERRAGESRVAATPETVKKLIALGLSVAVEAGAGHASGFPDAEYAAAGAEMAADAAAALAGASIVFAVRPPEAARILGVSPRTLWGWTKAGLVPCVRVGTGKRKTVLYSVADLQVWLTRQTEATKGGTQ